jgi:hypothetical protein
MASVTGLARQGPHSIAPPAMVQSALAAPLLAGCAPTGEQRARQPAWRSTGYRPSLATMPARVTTVEASDALMSRPLRGLAIRWRALTATWKCGMLHQLGMSVGGVHECPPIGFLIHDAANCTETSPRFVIYLSFHPTRQREYGYESLIAREARKACPSHWP